MGTVQLVECCSIRRPGDGSGMASSSSPRLTLTGQLGEVLEESAAIALTWVRSMCSQPGLYKRVPFYEEAMHSEVHVHLPAGSIPKDGPSAGVTLGVALTSLFFGIPCRADTAMTGEISLTGNVLAVGGVAEKVRAAQKIGISRVIVPEANALEARQALKEEAPFRPSNSTGSHGDGAGAGASPSSSSSLSSQKKTKVQVIAVRSLDEAIEAAIVNGNPWTAFLRDQGHGQGHGQGGTSQTQQAQLAAKL
mmetsp:Transcript_35647/g.77550  ORF Transcript_35647/g.77550 Transcript_35647/m.77550 type:complete len:250 (+) Transcript_35647:45-794(+)